MLWVAAELKTADPKKNLLYAACFRMSKVRTESERCNAIRRGVGDEKSLQRKEGERAVYLI